MADNCTYTLRVKASHPPQVYVARARRLFTGSMKWVNCEKGKEPMKDGYTNQLDFLGAHLCSSLSLRMSGRCQEHPQAAF